MKYQLNWNKLMEFKENNDEDEPKLSIPFSLDTTYLKRDFTLDIVVWNLTASNLEQTQKVVHYILTNFNRLFETAWTVLYFYLDNDPFTLAEFFHQIDFEDSEYYTIRLELNSDYLTDGIARYHFVVATDVPLSDDDIRLYMRDNKCWGIDSNNDGVAILESANYGDLFIPEVVEEGTDILEKLYVKMEEEQFPFAPLFCG